MANKGHPTRKNATLAVFVLLMCVVVAVGLVSYSSGMAAQLKTDKTTGVCK